MSNSKQFLELQPRYWKEIYNIYLTEAATKNPEELKTLISQKIESYNFAPEQASAITATLLTSFAPIVCDQFVNPETEEARLTVQDIKYLRENLLHEPSEELRRLLVAFLVYSRANPHPSFWIKYDRKVIFFLASLDKMRVSDQILLTNALHSRYNLDMQVVGSNQPTPCFRFSWQAEQPAAESEDNSLVLIGPLNPATIKSFVKQLPYEEATTDVKF